MVLSVVEFLKGGIKELDIILPIKEIYIFLELEWNGMVTSRQKQSKVAKNELLCLKNAGTQISMFFTSNE